MNTIRTFVKLGTLSTAFLFMLVISSSRLVAQETIHGATPVPPDTTFEYNDATPYEMGTIFRPLVDGTITGVRVLSMNEETAQDHTVTLWRNSDNTLLTGPITWNFGGADAWITLDIPDVAVQANTDYTVAVSVVNWYPVLGGFFASAGNNGQNLSWPAGAGVYGTTLGARPTSSTGSGPSYGRDIVFDSGIVPEPSTMGLALLGGLGFLAANCFRRK